MAYDKTNLDLLQPAIYGKAKRFVYTTTDALATVAVSGYFAADSSDREDLSSLMAAGDLVTVSASDGELIYSVSSIAPVAIASINAGELDGDDVANLTNEAVVGALAVGHRSNVAATTTANYDIVLTHKTYVTKVLVYPDGAGAASDTLRVTNGTGSNHISESIDTSTFTANEIYFGSEVNQANAEVAAGGTLRIAADNTGGSLPACTVIVEGYRVA